MDWVLVILSVLDSNVAKMASLSATEEECRVLGVRYESGIAAKGGTVTWDCYRILRTDREKRIEAALAPMRKKLEDEESLATQKAIIERWKKTGKLTE